MGGLKKISSASCETIRDFKRFKSSPLTTHSHLILTRLIPMSSLVNLSLFMSGKLRQFSSVLARVIFTAI